MKLSSNRGLRLGSAGFLTIIFIGLKMMEKIDWSWWWIFSPIWISAIIGIIVFAIVFLIKKAVGGNFQ